MIKNLIQHIQKIWELSLILAINDFKARNEGSYLGMLWYLLNPLLMFVVLWLVFSYKFGQEITLYPAYLLSGIILFNFFQQVTNVSTSVIIKNSDLIKSINFPRQSLVLSVVLTETLAHLFEVLVLLLILLFLSVNIIGLVFYPLILFFFVLFTYGVSLILASLTVYVLDFANIWRFFSFLLWLATPIFYLAGDYGYYASLINTFNPLYYFITLFRQIVIYHELPAMSLIGGGIIFSLSVFVLGIMLFEKLKYKMIEKI